MDSIIFAVFVISTLLVIRTYIVYKHRTFILRLLIEVRNKFIENERKKACKELSTIKSEEKIKFYQKVSDRMDISVNLLLAFDMYPSMISLIFSLDKWTRDQMYPYIEMNFALALADQLENIDKDLIL